MAVSTQADVEGRGWTIYSKPEQTVDLGAGEFRRIPGEHRAEALITLAHPEFTEFGGSDYAVASAPVGPQIHHVAAPSVEELLRRIDEKDRNLGRLR